MKFSFKLAAVVAGSIAFASVAHAKTWYTPNENYQCVNLGSPADRVRQLAAQGIEAKPNDGGYQEGIVSVKYQNAKGETTGQFFFRTKEQCEHMMSITVPVDSKYE